jgi:hypothetical protein
LQEHQIHQLFPTILLLVLKGLQALSQPLVSVLDTHGRARRQRPFRQKTGPQCFLFFAKVRS